MPVEGDWTRPPFAERVVDGRPAAVICAVFGSAVIVVDREDGRVIHLDPDGEPSLMNGTVAQLVACAQANERAVRAAIEVEEGESDAAMEDIADRLRAEIAEIDPLSLEDEAGLWPVIVTQLSRTM